VLDDRLVSVVDPSHLRASLGLIAWVAGMSVGVPPLGQESVATAHLRQWCAWAQAEYCQGSSKWIYA